MKTCLNCQWIVQQDEGYSNWTVMGYQATCMFGLNSFNSDDKDHDARNVFAEECSHFEEGIRLEFDVDCEDVDVAIRDWKALVKTGKLPEQAG